uniref:Uncharacterized protein n=1 Tax=Kalanchoe fedtschenkoi TaxID=63787 RepID=A0A7N0VLN9_KALFE
MLLLRALRVEFGNILHICKCLDLQQNFLQVRLFLNDEAPSQVGLGIQDHLQAKTSLHLHVTASEDNLPPGFDGVQPTNLLNNSVLEVPTVRWKRPPKLTVDLTWLVAAGEESQEIEAENRRGLRVPTTTKV